MGSQPRLKTVIFPLFVLVYVLFVFLSLEEKKTGFFSIVSNISELIFLGVNAFRKHIKRNPIKINGMPKLPNVHV